LQDIIPEQLKISGNEDSHMENLSSLKNIQQKLKNLILAAKKERIEKKRLKRKLFWIRHKSML